MKKITTTEIILTEEEAKLVKNCLDYCLHRIVKHGKFLNCGNGLQKIDKLRKELQ